MILVLIMSNTKPIGGVRTLNKRDILQKIQTKQLPLSSKEMNTINTFIAQTHYAKTIQLTILGGVNPILRKDWLDLTLDPIERATKNITVSSEEWRKAFETYCNRIINIYLQLTRTEFKHVAVVVWRSALAFLPSLVQRQFEIIHTKIRRNEKTLQIETLMPISDDDLVNIDKHTYFEYVIPDPMLGSGNSFSNIIEILKNYGVKEQNISLVSVVASPEGVYRLLNQYPHLRQIIVGSIDGGLNKDGYIINQGIGDAGDKYFYENSIDNFIPYRKYFTDSQWDYLKQLLGGT